MKAEPNRATSIKAKKDTHKHPIEHKEKMRSETSRNVEEFTDRFFQHPRIKKALTHLEQKAKRSTKKHRKHSKETSLPKAPKLLLQAIDEDERIFELAQSTRNVMKYYREVSKLLEEKAKGRKQDNRRDKAFIKKWSSIEKDYQTMIKTVCTVYRENQFLMASGKALTETSTDLDVFANPAFLGKDELAVVKYFGLTTDELTTNFQYSYLPNRKNIANGLASDQFENALKSVEKVSGKLPFLLSPKYLVQEDSLTIGGDFLFLFGLFAQIVSVITTIIAVAVIVAATVAVVATAAAVAATAMVQTAASVVQTAASGVVPLETSIEGNLDDLGDWMDEQGRKIRDWYDRNIKPIHWPRDDDDGQPPPPPPPLQPTSYLSIEKLQNAPGEKGDKYKITVYVYKNGQLVKNLKGLTLEILYGILSPVIDFYWTPMDWKGSSGVYTATWGPGYWTMPGPRDVRFTFTIEDEKKNVEYGNIIEVKAYPSNSLLASMAYEQVKIEEWESTTKAYTPEETIQLYGYVLGNMSRTKMEIHLPNCSFLHLVSPSHIQQFSTLQDGYDANLDNCHYCIGDSKR